MLKSIFKAIPLVKHSLAYNPSIDGLRGLAVLLVVLFHIWSEIFSFGYVGVDIFFVLSGFLITQIVYQRLQRGTFSLKEFYRNRIRRIFPATLLTLILVFVAGYLLMLNDELSNLVKHIKSSAFFYENFRLIHEVGYWDKDASLKPLLHFWSLAIEEQFYIFWPFVLMLLFFASSKLNAKISILLAMLCLAIFILPLFLDINRFYHLASRAYELAFGGLAFVLAKEYKKIVAYLHIYKKAVYICFALSLAASIANTEYSVIKTVFVVLTSCALIISLSREKQSRIFSFAPLIFLGLISFPLYLNHYAIISFCHILGVDISGFRGILVLVACVVLAYLTYRYIELYARSQKSYGFAGVLFVLMVLIGLGAIAVQKDKIAMIKNRSLVTQDIDFTPLPAGHPGFNKGYETQELMKRFNIPEIAPDNFYFPMIYSNTLDFNEPFNLVIGDSHAFYTGLKILEEDKKAKTIVSTIAACKYFDSCRDFMAAFEAELFNSENIKRLFITNWLSSSDISKKYVPDFQKYLTDMEQYLDRLLSTFEDKKYPVYFLVDYPHLSFDPQLCSTRHTIIADFTNDKCKFSSEQYYAYGTKIRKMIQKVAEKHPNIVFIDPINGFCDESECKVVVGKKSLYFDNNHLTPSGTDIVFDEIKKYINFDE